jgi:phage terminase large subunit
MGGAGSGKSYTISSKLIKRCCSEKIKVLVCRRYGTTLKNSCYSLFKDILTKWRLIQYVTINKTDMSFTFPNGSQIILFGLDDEHKLLSLNNISTVWIEEAYEVEKEKIEQLNLRMRGQAANQQLILSWNPISKNHWLYDFSVGNPPENSVFIHSTYKDNPFLNKEYIAALEEMYVRNPKKARVFCDGEWGIDVDGLVFSNWKQESFDPMELAALGYEHRCGLDLGWVDKTAITNSLYDRENKVIYVFEEFYKSGCHLEDIVNAIGKMQIGKTKIYVDAAEPRSIEFFKKQGVNATKSIKGGDSVRAGLMFLQNHYIIVHPNCKNLIMELENFSYIKSKITGEYTEDTTHEYSHAIDSLRYSYSDIYTQSKLKTLDKSVLNL